MIPKYAAIFASAIAIAFVVLVPIVRDPLANCPPGAWCPSPPPLQTVSVTYLFTGVGGIYSGGYFGGHYTEVYAPWTCSGLSYSSGIYSYACKRGMIGS